MKRLASLARHQLFSYTHNFSQINIHLAKILDYFVAFKSFKKLLLRTFCRNLNRSGTRGRKHTYVNIVPSDASFSRLSFLARRALTVKL